VGPGQLLSSAGSAYTVTAGAAGVTYIETWPKPLTYPEPHWRDFGWVRR